jgi:hypothetical protein
MPRGRAVDAGRERPGIGFALFAEPRDAQKMIREMICAMV